MRSSPRHRPSLAALVFAALVPAAAAEEVAVPVRFDLPYVRRAVVEQVFVEPGERIQPWDDGVGCGWLVLWEPAVDVSDGKLRVSARGNARVGTKVGPTCLVGATWDGILEVLEKPTLDVENRRLGFRVVDSHVYDAERRKRFATGVVWDLVKQHVHPRLATVTVDLAAPFDELRAWLPLVLPGGAQRADALLASLTARDPRVAGDAVEVTIAFTVEPRLVEAPAPEPALTEEEIARWEAGWRRWSAFTTFVTKRLARDSPALREALAEALLDARYAMLDALRPPAPGAPDPVPGLFLRTWDRLAPVLRDAPPGLPAATALRWTSFIAAGDALAALTRLGPQVGLDLSADGLRRLARMLAPEEPGDPLAYDLAVDPELRALLGFGPPLPPPAPAPADVELGPLSWLVAPAWAAADGDAVARVDRWVPGPADLHDYLVAVRALLDAVREETLAAARRSEPSFRELALATAWQESCWRQFVKRGEKLVPLRSPVGSVGIMQVNQHVWRGVYDLRGLQGDMAYNARAGDEILLRYLDWTRSRHGAGTPVDLGAAVYAVYNGGPAQLARYERAHGRRKHRAIDRAFREKLEAVHAGRELDVAACWGY